MYMRITERMSMGGIMSGMLYRYQGTIYVHDFKDNGWAMAGKTKRMKDILRARVASTSA